MISSKNKTDSHLNKIILHLDFSKFIISSIKTDDENIFPPIVYHSDSMIKRLDKTAINFNSTITF